MNNLSEKQSLEFVQLLTKKWHYFVITILSVLLISSAVFSFSQGIRLQLVDGRAVLATSNDNSILGPDGIKINDSLNQLKVTLQEKVSLEAIIEDLKGQLDQSVKNLQATQASLKSTTEELEKIKAESDEKSKAIASLQTKLDSTNSKLDTTQKDKELLEKQKQQLLNTIDRQSFRQTSQQDQAPKADPSVYDRDIPKPSYTSKTIQMVYFAFSLNSGNSSAVCSGVKNVDVIVTVSHCQASAPKRDSVFNRSITDEIILNQTSLTLNFDQENTFYIATVDKGIVTATAQTYNFCLPELCNNFYIKSNQLVGEGNSGSPVYDPSGKFVGVLSGGEQEGQQVCPVIKYNNPKFIDPVGNRSCGNNLIIARDINYRL